MVDNPQEQPKVSPAAEKGWDIFWNRVNRVLGSANIFRYRTLKGQAAPIKSFLPISMNENLIDLLTKIETAWNTMDTFLWDDPKKIFAIYEKLGHYDDASIVELEAEKLRTGSGFSYDPNTGYSDLRSTVIKWTDENKEELFIFGISQMADILEKWKNLEETLDQRAIAAVMDAGNRRFATNLRSGVAKLLTEIQETEEKSLGELLEKRGLHTSLATLRDEFLLETQSYKRYIRFQHTYKVIKPFFWDAANNRSVYIDPRKNTALYGTRIVNHQPLPNHGIYRYKAFEPWPWEENTGWEIEEFDIRLRNRTRRVRGRIMTGLDENGYPLEIDEEGVVLLDKWWFEIGENPWQRQVITSKPGGAEIIRRIDYIRRNGIRVVDKRFTTDHAYLDLLDMAVYIYNEVDSVRDDLRDGRFHKYSKTATDYIIHAEGGLNTDPNKFKVTREILDTPIGLSFNQFNTAGDYGYIKARPDSFDRNIPSEEIAVKRNYRIKEYNTTTNTFALGPERERQPTNISPAFDRRALNRAAPFIHWGRMYYYEDTEGINKWSENPYPHISTRGIAKYIMYWVAVRTQNIEEAKEAAESEKGYDIGVRRPLVGGKFIKNPFKDVVSIGGGGH